MGTKLLAAAETPHAHLVSLFTSFGLSFLVPSLGCLTPPRLFSVLLRLRLALSYSLSLVNLFLVHSRSLLHRHSLAPGHWPSLQSGHLSFVVVALAFPEPHTTLDTHIQHVVRNGPHAILKAR